MCVSVSVICVTYNQEAYISETIESFLMQKTNFEFEILIGEDCSTDGTREIVEKYIQKYPNKIHMVTSTENVGMMNNFTRTLRNAKGKYIALCDGDDYWISPNKLQKQFDYMEENPNCSLYVHNVNVIDSNNHKLEKFSGPATTNTIFTIEDVLKNDGAFFRTPSMFFSRNIIENLPQFFLDASVYDYPLYMWAADEGYIFYDNEVMASYRASVKGSWTEKTFFSGDARRKIIENHNSDISILNDFDSYTNHKYKDLIAGAISFRNAQKALMAKDFSVLNKNFKNLSFIKKVKLAAFAYSPSIFLKLSNLKWEVKRKLGSSK